MDLPLAPENNCTFKYTCYFIFTSRCQEWGQGGWQVLPCFFFFLLNLLHLPLHFKLCDLQKIKFECGFNPKLRLIVWIIPKYRRWLSFATPCGQWLTLANRRCHRDQLLEPLRSSFGQCTPVCPSSTPGWAAGVKVPFSHLDFLLDLELKLNNGLYSMQMIFFR